MPRRDGHAYIQERLAVERQEAARALELANLRLRQVLNDVVSPDAARLQVKLAQDECDRAYQAWRLANKRWAAFTQRGEVPEDIEWEGEGEA